MSRLQVVGEEHNNRGRLDMLSGIMTGNNSNSHQLLTMADCGLLMKSTNGEGSCGVTQKAKFIG